MERARRAILLVLILSFGAPEAAFGRALFQTSLEYPVKANYLVRFAAFAQWPGAAFAATDSPLVICVVGQDPFGAGLDRAAAGQMANGRPVIVRRPAGSTLAGCHIAYLGRGAVLPPQRPAGVLLVTDDAVSGQRGAIHFVVTRARVRFHIDQRIARSAGVELNSRLLNLALSVQEGRG
jgi:hypothetical protein